MGQIDKKFIINLQGKDFVTYDGLLDLAHKQGLKSIETELIQIPNRENNMVAVCKAVAKTKEKEFTDIGDASPRSVNNMLTPHIIRMAATRAKARALRDLTNIGMTAYEEIIAEDVINENKVSKKQLDFIVQLAQVKKKTSEMPQILKDKFNVANSKDLSKQQASELIEMLQVM